MKYEYKISDSKEKVFELLKGGGGYIFYINELKNSYIKEPDLSHQYAFNRTKRWMHKNHIEFLL